MTDSSDGEIPTPRMAAAWFVLGALPIERLPWWAAQWITEGHQGETLYELAGLDDSDPRAIRDLLPAALTDMKINLPPTDLAAAKETFSDIARRHAEDKISERDVADKVEEILILTEYSSQIIELPLGQLYGISDAWDAGWGPPTNELIETVRQQCTEQLNTRSGQ